MSTYVPIEWQAWRSEDTEPNSFYTVYGAPCGPAIFSGVHNALELAGRY